MSEPAWVALGAAPEAPAPSSPVVARQTAPIEVTNSAVETTMFSYTVPAGALGTDKMLRVTLLCDLLQNDGTVATIRLKFGGITWCADGIDIPVSGAQRQPLALNLYLMALGATNSQAIWGFANFARPNAGPPASGIGQASLADVDAGYTAGLTTMANIDTTLAQTFAMTVQYAAASTLAAFRVRAAIAEII